MSWNLCLTLLAWPRAWGKPNTIVLPKENSKEMIEAGGEGKEGGEGGEAYVVQLVRTGNNSCSLDSVCLLFGVLHTC